MRLLSLAVLAAAASAKARVPDTASPPIVRIRNWGANAVRVTIVPAGGNPNVVPPLSGLNEVPPAASGTSNIVAASDVNGLVTVTRVSDGAVLLKQTSLVYGTPPAGASQGTQSAQLTFAGVGAGERIVGFGEQQDGEIIKTLPFFRSFEAAEYYPYNSGGQALWGLYHNLDKGYSFLWNMPTYGYLNVSTDACTWFANGTQNGVVDFWVSTIPADLPKGASPLPALLSQYADVVGHSPVLPYYATGFVQSKDRYRNQSQLLSVARGYAQRQIPISMIVVDWFHWSTLGDMSFNPTCWPDPQGMVDELRSLGIELMVRARGLVAVREHSNTVTRRIPLDIFHAHATLPPPPPPIRTRAGDVLALHQRLLRQLRHVRGQQVACG